MTILYSNNSDQYCNFINDVTLKDLEIKDIEKMYTTRVNDNDAHNYSHKWNSSLFQNNMKTVLDIHVTVNTIYNVNYDWSRFL